MARHLLIADDAARLISAAQLAHCDASVDDPDLFCCACAQRIAPSAQAALIVLTDKTFAFVSFAHPACRRSGVYPTPGLREAAREHYAQKAATGIDLAFLLALRYTEPRALLFLESPILAAPAGVDLLQPWLGRAGARYLGGVRCTTGPCFTTARASHRS